jgi:Spy/CpxP family protein refolding chaperone
LSLVDAGSSPIVLNANLTGLKFFLEVTLDRAALAQKLRPVRVPRTLPVVLSPQEVARLIAGLEERSIKALSDQEIEDLRAGRGMAMALAAELNGYPGPLHTLELARELELTSEQEQRTRQLFAEMQQEAGRLGAEFVDAEEALDRLFREQEATPDSVLKATMDAAELRGRLRATHLLYHLEMTDVLSPEQVERYNTLRGYR